MALSFNLLTFRFYRSIQSAHAAYLQHFAWKKFYNRGLRRAKLKYLINIKISSKIEKTRRIMPKSVNFNNHNFGNQFNTKNSKSFEMGTNININSTVRAYRCPWCPNALYDRNKGEGIGWLTWIIQWNWLYKLH